MLFRSGLPLAWILLRVCAREQLRARRDLLSMLLRRDAGWGRRLRLVWLDWAPRKGGALFLSWAFVFLLALWAYDAPSMLRQRSLSLELMAAFGSFYDWRAAGAILLPPLGVAALVGTLAAWRLQAAASHPRSFADQEPTPRRGWRRWAAHIALGTPPALLLGVPFLGLALRMGIPERLQESVGGPLGDLGRSALMGIGAGALATGGACCVVIMLLGWRGRAAFRLVIALQALLLGLPSVAAGMGWAQLRTAMRWDASQLSLIALEAALVFPAALLALAIWARSWPAAWSQELRARRCGMGRFLARGGWRIFAPAALGALLLAFTLAIREVPAALLNYPPGGSTLAISVETMLHFDQPEIVSLLCLLQLALAAAAWTLGAGALGLLASRNHD